MNRIKCKSKKKSGIRMPTLVCDDPLIESIRDDPEFQQILRDVETKYRAEYERIRQWLQENEV